MQDGENECLENERRLRNLVEGALDAGERARLEAHVAACPRCSESWARSCRSIAAARAALSGDLADAPPAPESLVQSIIDKRLKRD